MTTPGGYSAGTIFLTVMPSFKDFQNAVRREAKAANRAFGDEQEKSNPQRRAAAEKRGEQEGNAYAGKFRESLKRGLAGVQREIGAVKIDADTAKAQAKVASLQATLKSISETEIGVDLTAGEALAELERLRLVLAALQADAATIDIEVDLGAALAQIKGLQGEIERFRVKTESDPIDIPVEPEKRSLGAFATKLRASVQAAIKALPDIELKADSSEVQQQLGQIRAVLQTLDKDVEPGVETTKALMDLARLRDELRDLSLQSVDPQVIIDAGTAFAELSRLTRELEKIDRMRVEADVDVDTDRANRGLSGLLSNLDKNGNSFRAFNGYVLAGATLLPLLVPAAVAGAGAIAAIGVAAIGAGLGLGVLIAGFTGIGDAVGALGDVQKNSAKDALAASRTMRSAGRAVREAEQGVARAREQAGEAAEGAARRVVDAARRVKDAERDLADAQEDATRAQQRLVDARRDAQDQLEDLALRARGGQLAERQAVIDLFEAEVAYRNAMADGGATNKDREEAAIALEQQRLRLEQIRLENGRLSEEQAEAAKTGVDGTETVIRAQEGLEQANERVTDSQRNVADAAAAMRDAQTDAARVQRDSARSIADAQERLADAQLAYSDAVQQTGELGSASMQKLNDAMSKLGPAGQAFARFLYADILPFLREARMAIQEGLLPGVTDFLRLIVGTYGPQLTAFLGTMGTVLGDLFREFGVLLTTPEWREFFAMLGQYAPVFTRLFGELAGSLLTIFAQLSTALAPLAADVLTFLVVGAKALSDFLGSAEGQEFLAGFMEAVREMGPEVVDFLGSFVAAVFNLGKALAPYALLLLKFFTGLLDLVAGMDPRLLGALAVSLIALTVAVQGILGLTAFLTTLSTVFAILSAIAFAAGVTVGGLLLIIATVVAVVAALAILYTNSETFRDIVNGAFKAVGSVIMFVWEKILRPVFGAIVGTVRFLLEVWSAVFSLIGAVFKAALGKIGEAWNAFAETGYGKAIIGFFDDKVKPAWNGFLIFVQDLWEGIKDVFKGGIRFVVDTVINDGLIDSFNFLADKFGSKKIDRLVLPSGFYKAGENLNGGGAGQQRLATGGRVAGFSPTDTADNIPAMLTAGEYVLPVGAVRSLRAQFGDDFLEMLRRGALPGFATGGLVSFGRMLQQRGFRVSEHPAFGGVRGKHAKGSQHYKGRAIDVNYGPGGQSPEEMKAIDAILGLASDYGLRTIWRTTGHFNHAHFDEGSGPSLLGRAGGALLDAAGAVVGKPLEWLRDKVRSLYGSLRGTTLGDMLVGSAETLLGYAGDKLVSLGAGVGDFFTRDGEDVPVQGYAHGGDVKLYDSGGWLQPGLTTVLNASGRPEPVFSAQQWERIEAGGVGGGIDIDITTQSTSTAAEIADELLWAARQIKRGGVYAGRKGG